MVFRDRVDAGRQLAAHLERFAAGAPVVEALPRGGVPVALEVARALGAPLDVLVVRKLGFPAQPELGMGAVGEGGVRVVNEELVAALRVSPETLAQVTAREATEVDRRLRLFRGDRPQVAVQERTVIIVDDGLATGFTARAAVEVMRQKGAASVVVAVPVAPPETVEEMRAVVDDIVCLQTPAWFSAIGQFYRDFSQVADADVSRMLAETPVVAGPSTRPAG